MHGHVANPKTFGIEEILKLAPLEERIYRLRCVEAWSMVIPWIGYSFSHIADAVQPTGSARFVQFKTFNPENLFPSEANSSLDWPYLEGLRIDEAMHPLTMVVLGMYGDVIPTQNGAPLRMMTPWKYGVQEREGDCRHRVHRGAAAQHLERSAGERVRVLCQCEPEPAASSLEPG